MPTTVTSVKRYSGDFGGGMPNIASAGLYDVAVDLCCGKFWQWDGTKWTTISLVTGTDIVLGAGTTLADKIAAIESLQSGVSVYTGASDGIPVEMQGGENDLVINHNLGVPPAFISCYYAMTPDTEDDQRLMAVPSTDEVISTTDGYWTTWRKFGCAVSNGKCKISLLALRSSTADDPGDGEELPDGSYMSLDDILQGEVNKYLSVDELEFLQFLQTRIATDRPDSTVLELPVYLRSTNSETGEVSDTDIMTLFGGATPDVSEFELYNGDIFDVGESMITGDYVTFELRVKNPELIEAGSVALYVRGVDTPVCSGLAISYNYLTVPSNRIEDVVDTEPVNETDVSFYLKYKDLKGAEYESADAVVAWRYPVFTLADTNDGDMPTVEELRNGTYVNQDGSAFDEDYILNNFMQNLSADDSYDILISDNTRRVAFAVPAELPLSLYPYGIGIDCGEIMVSDTVFLQLNDNVPAAEYIVYVYQALDTLDAGVWRLETMESI